MCACVRERERERGGDFEKEREIEIELNWLRMEQYRLVSISKVMLDDTTPKSKSNFPSIDWEMVYWVA